MSGATVAGLFFLTAAAFSRIPLLPDIGADLGLSAFGIGLLGSVFAVGRLIADYPTGRLSDRIGPGRMMAMAAGLVAVGSLLLAVAQTPWVSYVASLVLGLGSTWVLTAGMSHFARAPRARRGTSMSIFAAALLVGQSIGPAVGGAVGADDQWRRALFLAAGLALVVGVGLAAIRVPAAVRAPRAVKETEEATPVSRLVLTVIYLVPGVQFAIGGAVLQTLVPVVGDAEHGLGAGAIGFALGVGGVSRLISSLFSGFVSDRMSRRVALIPGQVLQVVGLAAFLSGELWAWYAGIMLVTFGSTGVNLATTVLADLTEGHGFGRRLGAFRFTGDVAFTVAPVLSGWLYELSGRVTAVLPVLAFATIVTLGVIFVIPETHRVRRS